MEKKEEKMETILTSEDVCGILGVSSRTLFSYRRRRIISFTQVGRKLFYRHADLQAFLDRNHLKSGF